MTTQTLTRTGLDQLIATVRAAFDPAMEPAAAASAVAASLRADLPATDLLTSRERAGEPAAAFRILLHAEPAFSIQAVVWRPGQASSIHDHRAWCVLGVLQGAEEETRYRDHGDHLTVVGHATNPTGAVHGFAPPGDIHKVVNTGAATTITLHVYGADLGDGSSSVLRTYTAPVLDNRAGA
ncbi:cysteine dioxygenase [Pseudonocardia sp. GCM10023141]|uniref:cysteine dioxygenase family protein n=1 Tax=Pseudonocardia sp. GCM10023141 TaxID=3252653 RepID=UPI00361F693A